MRKTIYFLLTLAWLITSCSNEKNKFILKGEISGLTSDTLLLYYQVPDYKLDTIICNNGVFEYSIVPDTFTVFSIIFNTEETLPIFAEKGQSVHIKGSTTELKIQGKGENKLMNDILTLLRETDKKRTEHIVDSLIQANKHSFTNLYLIDKYFVNSQSPDYKHLKELIENQSGTIKDTPYMMLLLPKIENFNNKIKSHNIHSLSGKDREGNNFKWSDVRDKYVLIDFWASWHPQSIIEQDSLQSVIKALKKEKFLICSLSLDLEKEAWLKASNRDTTQWKQICDFKGWNNAIIKGQNIHSLPSNLLLDKNKRIIARNIRGKDLINKVKELIKKDKERTTKKQKR
ncbi:MAG: AhpC/TSA family protein [Bacteroides sp.]|nr:AhpC/TSA family protein [Bacteroides sp.]